MAVKFEDNSGKVLSELRAASIRALERCGSQAEGYAKDLCPSPNSTGMLRNSITHLVDTQEPAVYVGSDSRYAPYVELGTGIYYPGGRKDPWSYQDAQGNWHKTVGNKPQPYIAPALLDHTDTYKAIIEDEFEGGVVTGFTKTYGGHHD